MKERERCQEIFWNLLDICIRSPGEEKWLQLVDFVSRSKFRCLEYGDKEYYTALEHLITSVEYSW